MRSEKSRKFMIGDRVKLRSGAELKYGGQMKGGEVVAACDHPGYGYAIKIKVPGEDYPRAYDSADLFEPE